MARTYKQKKRAADRDRTREQIVKATMELHDEQGVAVTSFTQIAERAGVGPATVYRHFPKLGDLVVACGAHVWQEMQPPAPDAAASVFAGIETTPGRLARLVDELDAFYTRGAHRLTLAGRDRDQVPELNAFLNAVETGVAALVREALEQADLPRSAIEVAIALSGFPVWSSLSRLNLPQHAFRALWIRQLESGMASVQAQS